MPDVDSELRVEEAVGCFVDIASSVDCSFDVDVAAVGSGYAHSW